MGLIDPVVVVLDGYTLNPGDLSWSPLHALASSCHIYDRTPPAAIVSRTKKATIVLTNKTPLNAATLAQLPCLRYIGVLATGYNVVDITAARARQVLVTNVPAYSTSSVVQMVFALLLELTRQVGRHAASVKAGHWHRQTDFCYWETPQIALDGLTMGIVGLGEIGQAVAQLAHALGMSVLTHQRTPKPLAAFITPVSLDTLFQQSDVVSLHCPLTPETHHLVNAARLALMKPSAFLINTSRGPVIDEEALAKALRHKHIAGAGLDVLSTEPPPQNHPLLTLENCLVTPHIAWATQSARQKLLDGVVANIQAFLNGQPQNVVA
jgi:glycerate dehydrogenase